MHPAIIHFSNSFIYPSIIHPSIFIHLPIHPSIHPCIHPSTISPIYPSIHFPSIHPCIHPSFIYSIHPFIHPSIHFSSIYPAIYQSIRASIHHSSNPLIYPSIHFSPIYPFIHLPSIHSSIIHSSLIVCISHLQTSEHLPGTHLLSYLLGRLCPSPQWQMSVSLPPRPQWCCGGHAEEACHFSSGHLEWFHPGCPLGSDPEHQSESMGRMGLYLGTSHKELEENKDTQLGCWRLSLRAETCCLLHGIDPTFSLFPGSSALRPNTSAHP